MKNEGAVMLLYQYFVQGVLIDMSNMDNSSYNAPLLGPVYFRTKLCSLIQCYMPHLCFVQIAMAIDHQSPLLHHPDIPGVFS